MHNLIEPGVEWDSETRKVEEDLVFTWGDLEGWVEGDLDLDLGMDFLIAFDLWLTLRIEFIDLDCWNYNLP